MGVLARILLVLLLAAPWQAFAWTLTCDNGTNHRYYDIIGAPYGRIRVESSGSRKGVRYQYRVKIDNNESSPNTFAWAMRRWSPPIGEWGDNTTGVALSDSGNATLNNGDVYFDLGNATGQALGATTYYMSYNATGYLSISANLMPKGARCLKLRAVGDNDTLVSEWVRWCYNRISFDGNFTYDNDTTDTTDDSIGRFGLQMGAH